MVTFCYRRGGDGSDGVELYMNGIQRDSFIPCIEEIKAHCQVICIDSDTDYRRLAQIRRPLYFSPLEAGNKAKLEQIFQEMTRGRPSKSHHTCSKSSKLKKRRNS